MKSPLERMPGLIALACAIAIAPFAACVGTPGRAIEVPVIARSIAAAGARAPGSWVTPDGWTVTLSRARLELAALRASPSDATTASLWLEGARAALLPVARAHGGHGASDLAARAELIGAMEIDALAAGELPLGVASGTAGPASTASIELGSLAGIDGVAAEVAGVATRDGASVAFEGALPLSEAEIERTIAGLPLDAELDASGRLALELRVDRWLDQVIFERLVPRADGAPVVIASGSQAALAWQLGLRDARAFTVVYESEGAIE